MGRLTAGVQYIPTVEKDGADYKDLRNCSRAIGYELGSSSPLSPSFNFCLEPARSSQHVVVQRRVITFLTLYSESSPHVHYLHSESSPHVAHNNLKAANILLDDEFVPHLCDFGLAVLRPFTGNTTKLKVSELAISYLGYSTPDNYPGRVDITKGDIFAFGVLLLELLTGRKPFDSTRTKRKQYLVRWASYRMHNYGNLEEMVDPRIICDLSSKGLSQFADIISLCIQPEAGFMATISEIVDSLVHLVGRNLDDAESVIAGGGIGHTSGGGGVVGGGYDSSGVDDYALPEISYHTTYTCFLSSPVPSYASAI